MTDEEFLGKWFARVTKPELAQYNLRMADAGAYRNTPRWDRERMLAQREFQFATTEARKLYEDAMGDLMALGEVSEANDLAMTVFETVQTFTEAAE